MRRSYTLSSRQLDLILQCLSRAEAEGAFKNCVVPLIGQRCFDMVKRIRDASAPEGTDMARMRASVADILRADVGTADGARRVVESYVGRLSDGEVYNMYFDLIDEVKPCPTT